MARKTKAEAEKTRQRILKAALDLFVEKGYERTTFEDVARHIRLTKGAVYWHFKSKTDLFAALVVDMTATHDNQIARVIPTPASLDDSTLPKPHDFGPSCRIRRQTHFRNRL